VTGVSADFFFSVKVFITLSIRYNKSFIYNITVQVCDASKDALRYHARLIPVFACSRVLISTKNFTPAVLGSLTVHQKTQYLVAVFSGIIAFFFKYPLPDNSFILHKNLLKKLLQR